MAKEDDVRHLVDLKHKVYAAQTPEEHHKARSELREAARNSRGANEMRQQQLDARREYLRSAPNPLKKPK